MNTLQTLIEAHKAAAAAFEAACDNLETVCEAYDEAHKDKRIVVKIGDIAPGVEEGREDLRAYSDDLMSKFRRLAPFVRDMSPEFADAFDDFIITTKQALYERIDAAIAEEEARQEAFGLAGAQRDWDRLSEAEREALLAICRHRGETIEEERARIHFIFATPSFAGCGDIAEECGEAIKQSLSDHAGLEA